MWSDDRSLGFSWGDSETSPSPAGFSAVEKRYSRVPESISCDLLQPIIVICGEPGGGKTKEASTALALSSKLSNLFANQV